MAQKIFNKNFSAHLRKNLFPRQVKTWISLIFFSAFVTMILAYAKVTANRNITHPQIINHLINENLGHRVFRESIQDFFKSGIVYQPQMEENLQKNFFSSSPVINGDFSKDISHWATVILDEKNSGKKPNEFEIIKDDYFSAPSCLKVTLNESPCFLIYSKNPKKHYFFNPWDYQSFENWLGVEEGQHLRVSLRYKGSTPTLIVHLLLIDRTFLMLEDIKGDDESSSEWRKFQAEVTIPKWGRAVFVQVVLNSSVPGRSILVDDIKIEDITGSAGL